jgi:ribosomal protein S18 acetylase RimI-like enzyme
MSENDPVRLDVFHETDADELVPMWRAAFEEAVGIVDPHPLAEQRDYFFREVLPGNAVMVARADDAIVGFVAASPASIAQLQVRVGWQRQGLGTRMLEWAKAKSHGHLWLYTFARNARARAFYEKHGFRAVAHGFEPTWKMDHVRYEWTRPMR